MGNIADTSIFQEMQEEMEDWFEYMDSIISQDEDEVDVITDHLPDLVEDEKCCTICSFSEPGDGCGANDLSELGQLEMKAELSMGI